ncbi:HU family DNA-binding protein [Enterococcus mundtii]|uniref:HU family DNA-binding protein n=1 Tax=Enterococcus mundtii TaxID=53346 RepID=UPI001A9600A0|nr:HU family DNA-binding protein [Enterococcus mundtii]MBO1087120.1 hypothetical protein [Enterococcus mundtii]
MSKTLVTKEEYVAKVAEVLGGTKKAAREAVDAVFGVATEIMSVPDRKFTVEGLATFSTEIKPAHIRKNNLTGETIDVPAKLKQKAVFSRKLSK